MPVTRASKQREAVYNELKSRFDHPTAETLYLSLKEEFPNISLATVYRNLKVLEREGLVNKIPGVESDYYDAHCHTHYHFTCTTCKAVLDLQLDENVEINLLPKNFSGEIKAHSLMYYGTCSNCK